MRKLFTKIYLLIAVCVGVCWLQSCTIETSDNGHLDGYWHLERIDTLSTGGVADFSEGGLFWGVEHKLLMLEGGSDRYYLRFRQTGDSLVVYSPLLAHGQHEGYEHGNDVPVEDASVLGQYGINNLEEHFVKEKLTGTRMVLRSESLRLVFRKF